MPTTAHPATIEDVEFDVLFDAMRDAGIPVGGCLPDGSSCIDFNQPSPGPIAVFVYLRDALLWASAYPTADDATAAEAERTGRHENATVGRCGAVVVSIEPSDAVGADQELEEERAYLRPILGAIEPLVGPC